MSRSSPATGWSERHQKLYQIGQRCRSDPKQLKSVCASKTFLHAKSIRSDLGTIFLLHTYTHTYNIKYTHPPPPLTPNRWCWRRRRRSTMNKRLKIRDNKIIKIQNTYTNPRTSKNDWEKARWATKSSCCESVRWPKRCWTSSNQIMGHKTSKVPVKTQENCNKHTFAPSETSSC